MKLKQLVYGKEKISNRSGHEKNIKLFIFLKGLCQIGIKTLTFEHPLPVNENDKSLNLINRCTIPLGRH